MTELMYVLLWGPFVLICLLGYLEIRQIRRLLRSIVAQW